MEPIETTQKPSDTSPQSSDMDSIKEQDTNKQEIKGSSKESRKGHPQTPEQKEYLRKRGKERAGNIKLLCSYYGIDFGDAQIRYQQLTNSGELEKVLLEANEGKEHSTKNKLHCPICNSSMSRRNGKFGPFLGCNKYPNCKGVRNLDKNTNPTDEDVKINEEKLRITMKFIQDIGGSNDALSWVGLVINMLNTGERRG